MGSGDTILLRMTADRYEPFIKLAKDGNRFYDSVWEGGIFESEVFYYACDRAGTLLWQHFNFACVNYPAKNDFLDLVREEIR